MKHAYQAAYGGMRLRPLEAGDIEQLRIWRNDPKQTRYLRALPEITPEMQRQWYGRYLETPGDYCFAIEETETLHRMVGSVSLYDVQGSCAEVGRIQIGDPAAHHRRLADKAMVLAMAIGAHRLGIRQFCATVHQDNLAARTVYDRIGFATVGTAPSPSVSGGMENVIELTAERLTEVNPWIREIQY